MSTPRLEPRDPQFAQRVRESFVRQGAMHTLGARLALLEPGAVDIELDWSQALTQQHGFLHAGMVSTALDSACGFAAFTLMPEDAAVLTIEFKINLLAPAQGESFRMEGRVLKPGRTITVCEGRAYALASGQEKLVATMGCTLMTVTGRQEIKG
ncbi:MAG: PaaI family thioesterase [Gammaproteobacteria bacterium]